MTKLKDIWAVMKAMYPHAFKEYGPVDGPVYRYWLTELAEANIDLGFAGLQNRASEFPPSLPEFKQMCRMLDALPRNDEDMRRWAIENGYGDARPRESWQQYRARLEASVNRAPALSLISNDDAA